MGINLGMIVEGSVAILLVVTIGYCMVLNARLKRLHGDRELLAKMVGDLVHATTLANNAIMELKTAALEADSKLDDRMEQAETLELRLATQISTGGQLVEKIARITAAAKSQPTADQLKAETGKPAPVKSTPIEPQSRLHSALQQLAMRPGIGGKAA